MTFRGEPMKPRGTGQCSRCGLPSETGTHPGDTFSDTLQLARDRIRELETALGLGDDLAPLRLLGLTIQQARVVNLLLRREIVTKLQVLAALYVDDPDRRYDVQDKIADVVMSKARHNLARLGVTFGSAGHGLGFRMLSPDKSRLRRLIESKARFMTGRSTDMRQSAARQRVRDDGGKFTTAAERA